MNRRFWWIVFWVGVGIIVLTVIAAVHGANTVPSHEPVRLP